MAHCSLWGLLIINNDRANKGDNTTFIFMRFNLSFLYKETFANLYYNMMLNMWYFIVYVHVAIMSSATINFPHALQNIKLHSERN